MSKEIIEGNKLIADFAGWKLVCLNESEDKEDRYYEYHRIENGEVVETDSGGDSWCWGKDSVMSFHNDWRRLMPVVEKIESIKLEAEEGFWKNIRFSIEIYARTCLWITTTDKETQDFTKILFMYQPYAYHNNITKIEAVWYTVIAFINWYNQQSLEQAPQDKQPTIEDVLEDNVRDQWMTGQIQALRHSGFSETKSLQIAPEQWQELKVKLASINQRWCADKWEGLYRALQGLVKNIRSKSNDTRYNTHLKIAEAILSGSPSLLPCPECAGKDKEIVILNGIVELKEKERKEWADMCIKKQKRIDTLELLLCDQFWRRHKDSGVSEMDTTKAWQRYKTENNILQ